MLAALERHYAFDAERAVIPNGRRGFRSRSKEPLVVGVGRAWDEAKNLAALERVAPSLPWPVLVLGEGSRVGRVSTRVIADAIGRASIFALPASYEPFGLSALEAALAGCALVLGDIPSLREVWQEAALFVEPGDEAALGGALAQLIGDERLRAACAQAARRRARRFTPERMADRYLALYRRVATGALEPAR
jgi:glycosyltransferase involved in cell wall biosynthesis